MLRFYLRSFFVLFLVRVADDQRMRFARSVSSHVTIQNGGHNLEMLDGVSMFGLKTQRSLNVCEEKYFGKP